MVACMHEGVGGCGVGVGVGEEEEEEEEKKGCAELRCLLTSLAPYLDNLSVPAAP